MAKGVNMKVNMTADNSDLVKKARESKKAVQDFEKVGSSALGKLGEAFGINTEKIELAASAIEGLGAKMKEAGGQGTKAFGTMLTSIGSFAAAAVALPVAGAIAGFKALNAEAEAFKNTVAGANIEMSTLAYIDTYRQVLYDSRAELGKVAAEQTSSWEKEWARIKANFSGVLSSGFIGAGTGNYNTAALMEFKKTTEEATAKAEEAQRISDEIYKLTRQISDKTVEWARMEREIAEYKRIAYDKTVSTADQQEALEKAVELITLRYGEAAEMEGAMADLMAEMNSLAESTPAQIDKANQQRVKAENITASMNNALRELSERQATVAANAQKEADARWEAYKAAKALKESRRLLKEWTDLPEPDASQLKLPTLLTAEDPGIAIPVRPVLDTSAVVDLANELESVLTSVFDSIGESLGSLIGDLMTGGDAWSNFGNTALSAFGEMAVSIGKMAISVGVAALGIKASLISLNGWAAIAAGTALVALGMAVKTGLSNIASGGYSSSASVATSGNYGSSTSVGTAFDTREIDIKVSGNLYASGNQLLAVIENENNRKNHTT